MKTYFYWKCRANRNAERSLREQQDAAYQLSLKADREKMERLRQEREAKEREEEEAKLALQELEQKRAVWHCLILSKF
jgi:FAS-associated factor 2